MLLSTDIKHKVMNVTDKQKNVACKLSIELTDFDTARTAAAKIHDFVADAIDDYSASEPTDLQAEFAIRLGIDICDSTRRTLKAKIADELEIRNVNALSQMNLSQGDAIVHIRTGGREVVSSIKDNGKIFFKGTGCQQTWASVLYEDILASCVVIEYAEQA